MRYRGNSICLNVWKDGEPTNDALIDNVRRGSHKNDLNYYNFTMATEGI